MQKKFIISILIFFIPVILGYVVLELLVLNIPASYKQIEVYAEEAQDSVEMMVLGSSQMQGGFNPKYIDIPAINLASGSQHHREDFTILKQMHKRFPKLKYVVLEVSYSHLEIPHNSKTFWKNAIYLKYYGVNAFERNTYFKDKLIYLSNTDVFSKQLHEYYIGKNNPNAFKFNKYGFNETDFKSTFKKLNYNKDKIDKRKFKIRNEENLRIFKYNTSFLDSIINYTAEENLKTIIVTVPTYTTYNKARNPFILKRRDSILDDITKKYDNVFIFNKETDTINYIATDYLNENHLNPTGAKKLSEEISNFITTIQ